MKNDILKLLLPDSSSTFKNNKRAFVHWYVGDGMEEGEGEDEEEY